MSGIEYYIEVLIIGMFTGIDYIQLMYNWYKGNHGVYVNPTKNGSAACTVYQFSLNKILC